MANFDYVNLNNRRYLTMWRGSACSLVLFGLVLVITGLGEMGIFASMGADCEEDDDGGDKDDINSDPSPLGNCT